MKTAPNGDSRKGPVSTSTSTSTITAQCWSSDVDANGEREEEHAEAEKQGGGECGEHLFAQVACVFVCAHLIPESIEHTMSRFETHTQMHSQDKTGIEVREAEIVHEEPGHAEQTHAEKDERQVRVYSWIYRAHISAHIFDAWKLARYALCELNNGHID